MTESLKPPSSWTLEEIMGTRHSAVGLLDEAMKILFAVYKFRPVLVPSDLTNQCSGSYSVQMRPYNFYERYSNLAHRRSEANRARSFTVEVRLLKKLAVEGPLQSLAIPKFGPMGSFEALEDKGLAKSFPGELLPDTLTWDITDKGMELLVLLKEEEKNDGQHDGTAPGC